jgi:RNA polymerase sigma-70 factor (ECF subfamily)
MRLGDARAERTLLVALGPALLRVVRGILGAHHPDVEDVLQESMVRVHDALPTFRGECMTLHFACRVAVHTAMNARRNAGHRARHTPSVAPEDLDECPDSSPTPAEAAASTQRRAALRELLDELPDAQAEVLALHVVLGYSVEETAAVMRVPHNTVRSRLRTALASLRDRVRSDEALLEVVAGGA